MPLYAHDVVKISSLLPLMAIVIPALAAVAVVFIGRRNEKMRDMVAFLATLLTAGTVAAMVLRSMGGDRLYFATRFVRIGGDFALNLEADAMGLFFALIASVVWVAAVAHASSYMYHEEKRTRFFASVMITEAATLGIFLVHDFFSLFIFFEIMGLAAYFLVIHAETAAAKAAANKYLYMTVVGGLSLLTGILLYFHYAGTVDFIPADGSVLLTAPLKFFVLVFFIAGFGVKAGMIPLHVWLPDAHPVAPSPGSALLSGVMIKAGAYGIIRVIASFFYSPLHEEAAAQASHVTSELVSHGTETVTVIVSSLSRDVQLAGFVLIWIALVTMFVGMALAVVQSDLKRTLAYSSVSQMGFILLGVGCFAYLGEEGAIGLTGSLYYILSHALFKSCLFLLAGSVLFCTHELNMFRLGGLYRKMPLTTVFWCIAAMGIMGVPLLNGFISKTLLHHAIVEAGHMASGDAPSHVLWLQAAEIIYIITAGGTVLYFLKTTYYTFFRKSSGQHAHDSHEITEAPPWMLGATGILAVGVLITGIFPGFILKHLIIPATIMFHGLDVHSVAHIAELHFFTWSNIWGIILPFLLGTSAFFLARYLRLFEGNCRIRLLPRIKPPDWLSINYCYVLLAKGFVSFCLIFREDSWKIQSAFTDAAEAGLEYEYHLRQETYHSIEQAEYTLLQKMKRWIAPAFRPAWRNLSPFLASISGDIALGSLAIAILLVFLLLLKLLTIT
ncbi:MAG: complex I subunit 5 family protein [Chloroflexota bacterium]